MYSTHTRVAVASRDTSVVDAAGPEARADGENTLEVSEMNEGVGSPTAPRNMRDTSLGQGGREQGAGGQKVKGGKKV